MRVCHRSVQAIALAGAVGMWTSSVLGQVSGLGKGHKWFLKHGIQIQGMASAGDPFNLSTYQAMNYTAINWLWDSSTGEMGPAPGAMPWARWVGPGTPLAQNSTNMPPIGSEGPYMSNLIALSLGDEPDLNNPAIRDQY